MPPTTPPTSPALLPPDAIKKVEKDGHKFNYASAAKKEGGGRIRKGKVAGKGKEDRRESPENDLTWFQ